MRSIEEKRNGKQAWRKKVRRLLLEEEESKEIGDNGVRAEERDINNRIPFSV